MMNGSKHLTRRLPYRLIIAAPVAIIAALMLSLGSSGCRGPKPVEPAWTPMTDERHSAEKFPLEHGIAENPSQDCAPCHGGLPSFSLFTCVTCHAHVQTTTDEAHAVVAAYVYESTACYTCHPTGTAISRDDHPYFPIAAGTTHGTADCNQCHTTASYQEFSCIDCHEHAQSAMDPAHSGVNGYVYASSACISCHPDGTAVSRDDHTDFPIAAGTTHAAADCNQCHTTASYPDFSCIDCHEHAKTTMDAEHAAVYGYVYASLSCLSCHPDGTAMSRQEHSTFFPITSGAHKEYACQACHKEPQSYQSYTCIGCHEQTHTCAKMDPKHDEVRNYQCTDSACLSCHPKGTSDD